MLVAVAVYESRPFFGVCRHDQEGIALAELQPFVRDGIYEAVVLLLDRLHLFVEFGLLSCPIAAETFEEADHAFFLKTFYPRLFSGRTRTASLVGTVACGMPILAEENIEGNYALPVELFGNEEHFLLHAKGYSMVDKGIYDGDIIVAKRQNTAEAGQVVVALIDDEATTKIFLPKKNHYVLRAANDSTDEEGKRCYPDIVTDHCEILGVVDNVIHRVR